MLRSKSLKTLRLFSLPFLAKSGLDPTRLDNPETQIKQGEKKVNMLIEESAFAAFEGNPQLALEKAKEAGM